MLLFMIRHGESEGNIGNRYHGQTDKRLTPNGIEQARKISPILREIPFDKVYSSDLSRAADTCANALPGVEFERLPLLREVDVGTLAGQEYGSVELPQTDDPSKGNDYTAFGGENLHDVRRRARQFLDMLEQQDHKYVAVFSHFGFINCLMREVLGTHFPGSAIVSKNCAIHVLQFNGAQWRIAALNYMTPLL